MIKYCEGEHDKSLVDVAPSRSGGLQMPVMSELRKQEAMSSTSQLGTSSPSTSQHSATQSQSSAAGAAYTRQPHIHIAAIDNSLSFPHQHPRGWRSFTYGWLYLPVNLIGRPFSEKTRKHFLPLLTSKTWWEETTYLLRKIHALDPDFNRKMFQVSGLFQVHQILIFISFVQRQLAVVKGQAWNIVQSLKHSVSVMVTVLRLCYSSPNFLSGRRHVYDRSFL